MTLEQAGTPQAAAVARINGQAAQLKLPGEASRDSPGTACADLIESLHDTNELVRLAKALAE
ncbi:MAG TPA: hypothetical protein VGL72_03620 [Bryobacteraceae bacterium]